MLQFADILNVLLEYYEVGDAFFFSCKHVFIFYFFKFYF